MSESVSSNNRTFQTSQVTNPNDYRKTAAQSNTALAITAIILTLLVGITLAAVGGTFLASGIASAIPFLGIGITVIAGSLVAAAITVAKSKGLFKKKSEKRFTPIRLLPQSPSPSIKLLSNDVSPLHSKK